LKNYQGLIINDNVGSVKQKSSAGMRIRLSLPPDGRVTLIPCLSCEGTETKTTEFDIGKYKISKCKWCDGTGVMDKLMVKLFKRWLGIWNFNRIKGSCKIRKVTK